MTYTHFSNHHFILVNTLSDGIVFGFIVKACITRAITKVIIFIITIFNELLLF